MIRMHIVPLLSSQGFCRSKFVWNRRGPELTHVLDIQLDDFSSSRGLSFTVNLGVFVEQAWRVVWGRPVPKTVKEVDCFPRLRIGKLVGPGPLHKDLWWNIVPETDADATGSELKVILADKAIPLLNQLDSIQAVTAFADRPMLRRFPPDELSLAVLKHLTGAHDEAKAILRSMMDDRRQSSWHDRVREVLARLGMPL